METLCTEGLILADIDTTISFKPDYKPIPTRKITFISFINVPLETERQYMTIYVNQNCHVQGVHYTTQNIEGIRYQTGTRIKMNQ